VDGWLTMLGEGRLTDLSEALIRQHYDPAYGRLRKQRRGQGCSQRVKAGRTDARGLARWRQQIVTALMA
jgi:tRNA 2-selenouridine synthase